MSRSPRGATLQGRVHSFNFSPKGSYEGLLLETADGLVQVNFSPEHALGFSRALPAGTGVALTVEERPDDRPRAHPVYELRQLPEGVDSGGGLHAVSGTVARLNYAKHGEPNGAVLDDGTFVHTRPDGARRAELAVGQTLTAEGEANPSVTGGIVLEAVSVNGVKLAPAAKQAAKKASKKAAKKAAKKHR